MSPPLLQIAVYISGHGYGHFTRTLNFLSLFSHLGKYNFHLRTTSTLYENHLTYDLHPRVVQPNAYQLDGEQSLLSLQSFNPSLAQAEETRFLKQSNIRAIISDAPSLPCLLAHSLQIPCILITNFTFDSIFQALLDEAPEGTNKTVLQRKVNEMSQQYALATAVMRLPGHISFHFDGPRIVDVPMHFRKAMRSRKETFVDLGLQCLEEKKVLLHCFGGHDLKALSSTPRLPEGWACISQTIDCPPFFYKISHDVHMPDIIGACDVVLGKLGWGTCCEVIGNGYKPFIYVPRSAFIEEVGLLAWMESAHRRIVRLEVKQYEGMNWQGAIKDAEAMLIQRVEIKLHQKNNDIILIKTFENILKL